MKRAVLAGASGLVGGELLKCLLLSERYEKVVALLRRPLPLTHPKLETRVIDFDQLDRYVNLMAVDDVFCCLGTTLKKTPDREKYYKIDVGYPLKLAGMARDMGASRYLIVSAMGADPHSTIFYNRIKGQVEHELKLMGLPGLYIFRPSLLLGERSEHRTGEQLAAAISRKMNFLFKGPLSKYRPIEAGMVARAMYMAAQVAPNPGQLYESEDIRRLAGQAVPEYE